MARRTSTRPARQRPAASGAAKSDYKPQCSALTEDGKQCRNSSRALSKYCASHKGYQPPAGKGLAKRIEGESWSAKDKLTDKQSRRNADTRPAVQRAADTRLAVRKAAKAPKKARPATRAKPVAAKVRGRSARPRHIPFAPVGGDETTGATSDPGFVANILQEERDYLVVYEEPDMDGMAMEDGLLLDIDAGQPVSLGEVNLEQKLDLELSNNTNWVGKLGFVLSVLGAVVGFGACVLFAISYPDPWYTADGNLSATRMIPGTVLVGVVGALMMLSGVILTHYGRRIQAKGNLSRMRIVEKAFQPRVALGDES
ncbi:MAG: hypothetical protein AABY18_04215 [Candidatus Thermoplasmatota archaeon]